MMSNLPESLLRSFRACLLERAAVLRGEIAAKPSRHAWHDAEVTDQKDIASDQLLETIADAEVQRDRFELREVEAALERIDKGHYGECPDCGEAIEPARLAAVATALRCAACQQRAEGRSDAASSRR
jgi:DnaK suppressor protein